jgi:amino acid transporter
MRLVAAAELTHNPAPTATLRCLTSHAPNSACRRLLCSRRALREGPRWKSSRRLRRAGDRAPSGQGLRSARLLSPQRTLGLTSLVSLVVANMIGAGVFTTSGFALADLGSADRVMAAWVVGGLIALCGAISYGGLVRHMTESGGEYLFLSRIVHPVAGFIAGWVSLLAGFTGAIAFAALAFETYLMPERPAWLPGGAIAITVVVASAGLHAIRVGAGAVAQNIVVGLKLLMILAFLAFVVISGATPAESPAAREIAPFSPSAFAGSLVWISLSYSGFNAAVYVAGEARNAAVNTPRALWLGTVLVMALYLALNAVFVYLPPYETVAGREDVAAAAAFAIGGDFLSLSIRLVIALALVTSVISMVMAGPRVYAQMAADGVFPHLFRFEHGAPRAAVALQAGLAIIVILAADLKTLLSYLGFTLSLSAALSVASLFFLARRQRADFNPPWGYPVVPAVYILATLALAVLAGTRTPAQFTAATVTIASGSLVYYLLQRLRRR